MSQTMTRQALLTAITAATVPSWELDEKIFAYDRAWSLPLSGSFFTAYREAGSPRYSTNFDHAIALVRKTLGAKATSEIFAAAFRTVGNTPNCGGLEWSWSVIQEALVAMLTHPALQTEPV